MIIMSLAATHSWNARMQYLTAYAMLKSNGNQCCKVKVGAVN